MKFNRMFIVVIIVLMTAMLLFETSAPNRYRWNDYSFSHKSKHPFGCYVMDSVLRASLPQGYEVIGSDIDKYFNNKHKNEKHTFLFTFYCTYDYYDNYSLNLLELIQEGNNVVFAIKDNYVPVLNDIKEKLDYSSYHTYQIDISKESLSDTTRYDTINWNPDDQFATATYLIKSAFVQNRLLLSDSFRTLATLNKSKRDYSYNDNYYADEDEYPVITIAGIREYGKGKVVVVSTPMIFTNYGFLDDNMRPFALRLLSECGNLPVVRYDQTYITHVDNDGQESSSPLRYLLSKRPLRWAFYLALATLVVFVLFSARRRQRVIPVIRPPKNHMMDFVKRIGGIYYQRHDNVDLLIKKYFTFSNDLRVRAMIDINNYDNIDEELQSLSTRTGIPFNELRQQIFDVWSATNAESIGNERLQQLIDSMNNILQKINI